MLSSMALDRLERIKIRLGFISLLAFVGWSWYGRGFLGINSWTWSSIVIGFNSLLLLGLLYWVDENQRAPVLGPLKLLWYELVIRWTERCLERLLDQSQYMAAADMGTYDIYVHQPKIDALEARRYDLRMKSWKLVEDIYGTPAVGFDLV